MKTKILLTFILLAFLGISQSNAQSCHASFTISAGCGPSFTFTNYSYKDSTSAGTLTYEWHIYDSASTHTDTSKDVSYTFTSPGTYYVCLTIWNDTICSDSICKTVTYDPNCDSCNITVDYSVQKIAGATYQFNTFYTNNPPKHWNSGLKANWDFGDGTTYSGVDPNKRIHTYSQPGNYLVCYTVYDTTDTTCFATYCDTAYIMFDSCLDLKAGMSFNNNGATVQFSGSRIGGGGGPYTYSWNFGDGNSGHGASTTHTYNTSTSTIFGPCLTIYDSSTGCSDIICDTVTIDTCHLAMGLTYTKRGDSLDYVLTVLGGTGHYIANWSFSGVSSGSYPNQGTTLTKVHHQTGTILVHVSLTDSISRCSTSTSWAVHFLHSSGASICGYVHDSVNWYFDSAIIYLIKHDSTAGTLTAIDSTIITAGDSGYYCFHGLGAGQYRVKAALLPGATQYSSYLPTYYKSSLSWSTADIVSIISSHYYNVDIGMIPGVNLGGPGFIGGSISAGANKTNNLDELDIAVILTDGNDKPLAFRRLDANYEYAFDNLPYGTYKVFVEIPGRTSAVYTIVLDENNKESGLNNFEVNSTYITTSTGEVPFILTNKVYPNPASDVLNVELNIINLSDITLELLDMQGRVVATTTYNNATGVNTLTLSTEQVQAGVYMLRIKTNDFSTVNKIIISK